MSVTLSSSRNGYFYIDGKSVPVGSVTVRQIGTDSIMMEAVGTGRVVMAKQVYSNVTNGDTAQAFASLAALQAWINANVYVSSNLKTVSASFTRPADTTAYAVKDVIANSTSAPTLLTFSDVVGLVGGAGRITKAMLMTSEAANTATVRLHLYNASITAINDNAANTVLYANRDKYIGAIDFPALAAEGSGSASVAVKSNFELPFVCDAADNDIYGVLEIITGTPTPENASTWQVKLSVQRI